MRELDVIEIDSVGGGMAVCYDFSNVTGGVTSTEEIQPETLFEGRAGKGRVTESAPRG